MCNEVLEANTPLIVRRWRELSPHRQHLNIGKVCINGEKKKRLCCGSITAVTKSTNYSDIQELGIHTLNYCIAWSNCLLCVSRLAKAQLWDTVIRISWQITMQEAFSKTGLCCFQACLFHAFPTVLRLMTYIKSIWQLAENETLTPERSSTKSSAEH